nr:hypothetical protein CFP56_52549 [Quercus suber]
MPRRCQPVSRVMFCIIIPASTTSSVSTGPRMEWSERSRPYVISVESHPVWECQYKGWGCTGAFAHENLYEPPSYLSSERHYGDKFGRANPSLAYDSPALIANVPWDIIFSFLRQDDTLKKAESKPTLKTSNPYPRPPPNLQS